MLPIFATAVWCFSNIIRFDIFRYKILLSFPNYDCPNCFYLGRRILIKRYENVPLEILKNSAVLVIENPTILVINNLSFGNNIDQAFLAYLNMNIYIKKVTWRYHEVQLLNVHKYRKIIFNFRTYDLDTLRWKTISR